MVFRARRDNNGEIDKNINTKGSIRSNKEKSRREIKEQELLSLLRKIKPHIADSVMTASRIMKNDESADSNKLKSAALLISLYKELLKDAYEGGDEEAEGTEVQPNNGPVFSLKIVGNDKTED
jgi:hypothetical protein